MDSDGTTSAIPAETQLFAKMARVMGIVNRVPKSGFNSFHKYKYASADDVADVIREALSEVNLAFIVQMGEVKQETVETVVDGKQKSNTRTTVKFTFTFACGDTGAVISSLWVGQVDDNSDKAINKCATSAVKYFLMKTFIVSAGDEPDPDADKHTETPARRFAPPDKKWHEDERNLHELSERAFTSGYIQNRNGKGLDELAKLIADKTWSDFETGKDCWLAIKEIAEARRIISDDGTNRKASEPAIVDPEAQALLTGSIPADEPLRSPFADTPEYIEAGMKAVADKLSVDKTQQRSFGVAPMSASFVPPQQQNSALVNFTPDKGDG